MVFFPPDWPRRLAGESLGKPLQPPYHNRPELPKQPGKSRNWVATFAVAVVAVYVAVQLLLPLRHYAYPGNVRWNEEGYRFAWRVLLTEKVGMVEYRVIDPASGQRWRVTTGDYLTPLQSERITTQPDMILETAHIIARDFATQGFESVQVFADVFVSTNGRPNSRLVEPEVDLAAVNNGFAPKTWLLPRGTSRP